MEKKSTNEMDYREEMLLKLKLPLNENKEENFILLIEWNLDSAIKTIRKLQKEIYKLHDVMQNNVDTGIFMIADLIGIQNDLMKNPEKLEKEINEILNNQN